MGFLRKIKRRVSGTNEDTKAFLGSYDEWTKQFFPVMKKRVSEELSLKKGDLQVGLIRIDGGDSGWLKRANDLAKETKADYISFQEEDSSWEIFSAAIRTAAKEDPDAVLIYTDSDRIGQDGKYHEPSLKPDISPYYLCSYDYIKRAFAVKRSAFMEAGGLDEAFSEDIDAALLDLKLRLIEKGRALHFPGVYYHSASPDESIISYEAGKRAVSGHFKREGLDAEIERGEAEGTFSIRIRPVDEPLISVIIPNKDHTDELEKCIKSLEKSTYRNLEIIIVENNSTLPETFSYYERLSKESSTVRIIKYEGAFNYSKINNFGVSEAKGTFLLFLNNDTEMIAEGSIKDMLSVAGLPGVGAVGARLFYPDRTVQHAGVTLGVGGIAANAFSGAASDDPGYMNRICCMQELSAVTAACLLMKREDFDEIGGFTEGLAVAFNDVDLCMKLREKGKLIIYYPNATFFHYESKSRGTEDTEEKVKRFNSEIDLFKERWEKDLEEGDPYYNPYLTLSINDFSLMPVDHGNKHMSEFSSKLKRRIEKVRRYGFVPVVKQYLHRKLHGSLSEYRRYMKEVEPSLWDRREKSGPILFSVCVPVYNCRINELKECVNSVLSQTYKKLELILSDDCSTDIAVKRALSGYKKDPRVKLIFRKENGGISRATNDAIEAASGDFVCFMDCDDVLSPHALMEFFAYISDHPDTDLLYSDEDKLSEDSKRRYEPFFKPDWSPDTFMSLNYVNHFSAVRRSLLNEVGGLRPQFDGAQDYDLYMRVSEKAGNDRIGHVPKVLYHWRATKGSTAKDPNAKQYVFEAAKKLKEEALKRQGIKGKAYFSPETYQVRVVYDVPAEKKLSVIIPSKDNPSVLKNCIASLFKEDIAGLEIIIVDNGSSDEARRAIEAFAKENGIRYIYGNYPFNFSKMCNTGASEAKGDILLFLNDDTEILKEGTLKRMMGQALQESSGAVGAKLLYPDKKKLQHCGILNLEIGPSHALLGQSDEVHHYFDRNRVDYDFLAVTGACLMVEKKKFESVGGFDENLPVAYNDIELCFKLYEKDHYNVLRTDAVFIHYESLSRGSDETPEKKARRESELEKLYEKHPELRGRDPFYNPNLIKNGVNFQIGLPFDRLTEKSVEG